MFFCGPICELQHGMHGMLGMLGMLDIHDMHGMHGMLGMCAWYIQLFMEVVITTSSTSCRASLSRFLNHLLRWEAMLLMNTLELSSQSPLQMVPPQIHPLRLYIVISIMSSPWLS